jgi:hypothetical protein
MFKPVKCLFVAIDGRIHAENVPIGKREIQFIDGAHPLVSQAVYHDIDGRGPPLVIYWQNHPSPEGVELDFNEQEDVVAEAVALTQFKLRPLISKRWVRMLVWSALLFFKAVLVGFLTAFIVLVVLILLGVS